jgi:hypothetical protein
MEFTRTTLSLLRERDRPVKFRLQFKRKWTRRILMALDDLLSLSASLVTSNYFISWLFHMALQKNSRKFNNGVIPA